MAIMDTEVDGIMVPVGIDVNFFGASEDEEVSEMKEPIDSGIINYNNENIITFATATQAMASLYFAKFSIEQIKTLIPQLANVDNVLITKMIQDTCSRDVRQDFIKSLHGNLPRQLTVSEMVKVVKAVGYPEGRPKKINLEKTLAAIEFDMEHVDLIKPEVLNPRRPLTVEQIQNKINKIHRSLKRKETRMNTITKKLGNIEITLATDATNERANYNKVKLSGLMEDLKSTVNGLLEKLATLESELKVKQQQ